MSGLRGKAPQAEGAKLEDGEATAPERKDDEMRGWRSGSWAGAGRMTESDSARTIPYSPRGNCRRRYVPMLPQAVSEPLVVRVRQ